MRTTIKTLTSLLLASLLFVLPAQAFAAAPQGWRQETDGWRYYQNGAPLKNVNWIEAEGNFYIFDSETGLLQTGDADGDVAMNGHFYYINPQKNPGNPRTCYAMRSYTRSRGNVGITFYDASCITFVGWIKDENGNMRYQTRIPKENTGTAKDVYIYVWRAQTLPECQHPDHPGDAAYNIPAGRYLFGDDGVLVTEVGWHDCNDGKAYKTDARGRILAEGPLGTTDDTENPQTGMPETPETPPMGRVPLERARGTGQWASIMATDETYEAVRLYINQLRAEKGLAPLTMDAELSRLATQRCMSFANGGVYDHSGKLTLGEIICGGGCVEGPNGGAVIAGKWYTAQDVVCDGWRNSPGHYANILDAAMHRMGVGCVFKATPGPLNNYSYSIYWTVTFER